ncbi:Putative exported protein [Corynebacterium diphtheriae]|uniref:Exported protein n=1 Tax=Corynebacterium diphtheriae (strain ATCC 700971 / NCTC 13129 / Biotype gravis) TaxID=257309 RepID=Q6NEN9_CORDI|nr:Putative exported protein [Corynebacterium diphtheriae]
MVPPEGRKPSRRNKPNSSEQTSSVASASALTAWTCLSKTHAAAHPAATADCSPATSRTSAWYAWGNQTNASICPLPCRSHRLPRPAAIFVRLSGDHPQGRRSSDALTNPEDEDVQRTAIFLSGHCFSCSAMMWACGSRICSISSS